MKLSIQILTAFIVFSSFHIKAQKVHFKTGIYLPEENVSDINLKNSIDSKEVLNQKYYRFIQFDSALSVSDHEKVKSLGITLLEFIPTNTYIASIPVGIVASQMRSVNIRSVWKSESKQRLHPDVINQSLPDYSMEGDNALLIVQFYKDLPFDLVIGLLEQNDIEVLNHNGVNNFIEVSVPLGRANSLSDLPFISNVDIMSIPGEPEDRRGRALHRVNKLNPNYVGARNYTGKGITTLVRDDGALFDHPDFKGRIDQTFVGVNRGDHGDGVAGIMNGAGNLNPVNRGMAHESDMFVTDYDRTFLDETISLFNNRDVIVTNSSYSDGCNAGYTAGTRTVDQQVFENPTLMHVFSAGNSGQGILNNNEVIVECGYGAGLTWANITGGHKIGKNVIATANLNFQGEIMASSSRGPARDGRIKPDIAANGNNHVSTAEENGYRPFGGTSGAAPVVAGTLALLHEAYEINHGERANASLLKAIMLNTANDYGNIGPDYIYGWGSLNAHRAALTIEEGRFLKDQIEQDEVKSHQITVPENVSELRIMTYWMDKEASSNSGFTLFNDLSTSVTGMDQAIHYPWLLDPTPDPAILNSPAIKAEGDFLNNMEQVAIDNPEAGIYTLNLTGRQLPFGSGEYFVVWEFRTDDVEIIWPDGGEKIRTNSTEMIHWDAEGNDGEFEISLINDDGSEKEIATVSGTSRYLSWNSSNNFNEAARLKIKRGDKEVMSTAPFTISGVPTLDKENEDTNPSLHWNPIAQAVSYNIFTLGEKFMEISTTVEVDSFLIPDEAPYKNNWLAVSANFANGAEGLRSIALSSQVAPVVSASNDQENKPCVDRPVVFTSENDEENTNFNWVFGSNAIPEMANTKGPHTVIYREKGNSLSTLIVTNDGGEDEKFFVMNVKDEPQFGETEITPNGEGSFTFKTNMKFADDYIWDFGDGNTAEGKTVTHQFTESGSFSVKITAENKCGIQTDTEIINFDVTDVSDLTIQDFVISPNPNQGDFSVQLPDLEGNDLVIGLISIDGKLIDRRTISNSRIGQRVEWNSIQAGVYVLTMKIGQKEISERIIVK